MLSNSDTQVKNIRYFIRHTFIFSSAEEQFVVVQTGGIRSIIAIPGYKTEKFKENVDAELTAAKEERFNKLGEYVKLVSFKEATNQ